MMARWPVASRVVRRSSTWVGGFVIGVLFPTRSIATETSPVVVTMLGPGTVRIRVSEGSTTPCDSGDDRILVEGKFPAGAVIRTSATGTCVCVQQTFEPFVDEDWSVAGAACRAAACGGRGKPCVRNPDPTIRVRINSKRDE
jgi:hypothetical protein